MMRLYMHGNEIKKKYGHYRFSDYYSAYIVIIVDLVFGIGSIILNDHKSGFAVTISCCWICGAVIQIGKIILSNLERYELIDFDQIIAYHCFWKETIPIPDNPVFILSKADICPPFSVVRGHLNDTFLLKDKYAISILHSVNASKIVESFPPITTTQITLSIVETVLSQYVEYSFVVNEDELKVLLKSKPQCIVAPLKYSPLLNQYPYSVIYTK